MQSTVGQAHQAEEAVLMLMADTVVMEAIAHPGGDHVMQETAGTADMAVLAASGVLAGLGRGQLGFMSKIQSLLHLLMPM